MFTKKKRISKGVDYKYSYERIEHTFEYETIHLRPKKIFCCEIRIVLVENVSGRTLQITFAYPNIVQPVMLSALRDCVT